MAGIVKELRELTDARVSQALENEQHRRMADLRRVDELYHAMAEMLQVW